MSRNNFYGNNYSPHLFIDGLIDGGSSYSGWGSLMANRKIVRSNWEIQAQGFYNESTRKIVLHTTVTLHDVNPPRAEFLRIALVENDLSYGGRTYNQVMRDMVPTPIGETITIDDYGTFENTVQFYVDDVVNVENCQIVIFIQSMEQKEIFQGFKLNYEDLIASDVDDDNSLPENYLLLNNYPNPFNSSTNIEFTIPAGGHVSLTVYNILGQEVSRLADGNFDAGTHDIQWDAPDNASGIYFYRLQTENKSITKRMSLIK